jgi:signal transduction histidine kinase
MTLKRKINLVLLLALAISNFSFFVWIAYYSVSEMLTQERFNLRELCRGIEKIYKSNPKNSEESINVTKKEIIRSLWLQRNNENITFKILDSKGQEILNNNCIIDKSFFKDLYLRKNYKFDWDLKKLEFWDFKFLYKGDGITIIIDCKHTHRSVLDKLIPVFLIASISILIFTIIASMIIIRRVLKPVEEISEAVAMVGNGNLDFQMEISNAPKIDELEQLKVNLNKTFLTLKESFSTISNFSSNVAHELRTPLTILLGNLEVGLRRPREKEEYQIIINDAIITVREMQHLIEDMLLMLKPVTAYNRKTFERIELSSVLKDVTEQFEILAITKKLTLKTDISENLYISGISTLIRRIFINIIDNAIKFSPENSSVKISLKRYNNTIKFIVCDDGSGIPEENIDQIFERFFKGKDNKNNHGLGLAMTKQLVAIHNAHISVNNREKQGACFTIIFPISIKST